MLKDYKQSEKYYTQALDINSEAGVIKGIIECHKALMPVYAALGNYQLALEHHKKYYELRDSSIDKQFKLLTRQLEMQYRTSEKDKELARQEIQIQKKEHTIKSQNRLLLFVGIGSVLSLALLATLYHNRKQKKNLEILQYEKNRQLAQLKARMEGEEKERERIARELHDGIMVQLSAAQMSLSTILTYNDLKYTEEIEYILNQMEEATQELRKSVHNLMPDLLLKEGLIAATQYFIRTLEYSYGISINFQSIGMMPRITRDHELMIYRMIQELLHNIIKHAHADFALVQIHGQTDMVSIVIEDNGTGWEQADTTEGTGLRGIQSRVQSLNGHFNIRSQPDRGTSVYIEIETEALLALKNRTDAY